MNAAVLSGGNGSNSTTQLAIATIDPRYGNTFTIDTSKLTPYSEITGVVYIHLKSAKPNVGALRPGKVINIVFKFTEDNYTPKRVDCTFDTSLGTNILPISSPGGGSRCASFSMVADGAQFQLLSTTNEWGWTD